MCLEHDVLSDEDLWDLATTLKAKNEPGLLAFLMDSDDGRFLRKVKKVSSAKTAKSRGKKTRMEILEECTATLCVCGTPNDFYARLKRILERNNLDGAFQKAVCDAMVHGRQKRRCSFSTDLQTPASPRSSAPSGSSTASSACRTAGRTP